MMRLITILTASLAFCSVTAQELRCTVKIESPQITASDKSVFQTLEKAIIEFMNNTKWTDDKFSVEERIECRIMINITEQASMNYFRGTANIQAGRPVFNTNYSTVLIYHADKDLEFEYTEFQPLIYNETAFTSNLTSMLAFYAYIIIGMDHDSFSPRGGTPHFQKAQNIVNNAQNAVEPGWHSHEGLRNRYWLIENLLSPPFEPMREAAYKYHRGGIDLMYADMVKGRASVLECLNLLMETSQQRPNSMLMQMFFNAKSDELANIFTKAGPNEKAQAVQLLSILDPSNTQRYQKIMR